MIKTIYSLTKHKFNNNSFITYKQYIINKFSTNKLTPSQIL